MQGRYDAIIIGAGHNGLVTACYLARAGKKVLVLERRHVVGGVCVTEETFPGFKVSTAAYVNSLFRPEIIRDLKLADHGFAQLERMPASFSPFLDGRYLMMGGDKDLTHREISKFSKKDAEAFPKYEAMLERVAAVLEPTLIQKPANLLNPTWFGDIPKMLGLARGFQRMGMKMSEAVEVLTGPARPILDRWFESEQLKATLATDAIIGAFASPSMPGTAYVLFHHVMGETNGKKGVWAYVKGGMGGLTQALASVARSLGVEIKLNAPVAKIDVKNNAATGVTLVSGDAYTAPVVASNADCHVTFTKLMDTKLLPPEFAEAVGRIGYESASLKINVALERLPSFKCLPGHEPGPQHRGTVHICPDQDYIERAYDEAKYGEPSSNPVLECTMASAVDPTVAPPGKHLMSMFIQYAPYKLKSGTWDEKKDAFADRCFDILEEYAPGFKSSVIARQVVTPLDLEREFSLTGGNIFQGAMTLNQLFVLRPVVGFAGYKTPVKGLYLCGAAAHPGGGVIGASGWNAARVILGKE
ncbi:MAG: phytoene desaturase family protein [Gemmataceae bacterium]